MKVPRFDRSPLFPLRPKESTARCGGTWAGGCGLRSGAPGAHRPDFSAGTLLVTAVAFLTPGQTARCQDVDPWEETQKILGEGGIPARFFGRAVDVDGEIAVVGSQGEPAAHVFRRNPGGGDWSEEAKLTPANGAARFGEVVSVSGDTVLVGASGDRENGGASGSAFVYRRRGAAWVQDAKLLAPDGARDDTFGRSVSIDGNTALVGAFWDDDRGNASGSAYVFQRAGPDWIFQQKLTAADGAAIDEFGHTVSLSGDVALVGAHRDDDLGTDSGSVYVFVRSGNTWRQEVKLNADDGAAGNFFGSGLALDGGTALVTTNVGKLYVFERDGGSWTQAANLMARDHTNFTAFWSAVSLSGDLAVVGNFYDNTIGRFGGAAYILRRSGGVWSEEAKLGAGDAAEFNYFGRAVATDGRTVLCGSDSGVYVFRGGDGGDPSDLPPVITGPGGEEGWLPDIVVPAGTSRIVIPFRASDPDGPFELAVKAQTPEDPPLRPGPSSLRIEGAGPGYIVTVDLIPGQTGVENIIVEAADGNSSRDLWMPVVVRDDAPAPIAPLGDIVAGRGAVQEVPFTLAATGLFSTADALRVEAESADRTFLTTDDLMLFDDGGASRTLVIPLMGETSGEARITVALENATATFERSFLVTVPRNQSPVITSEPPRSTDGSGRFIYRVEVFDPDEPAGGGLSFRLEGAPEGMVISSNGVITWMPDPGIFTSGSVWVVVSDGGEDGSTPARQRFEVEVAQPPNEGPAITSQPPASVQRGQVFLYQVEVFDPDDLNDGSSITFRLSGHPAGMEVSSTGLVSWMPSEGQASSGAVTVTAADGGEDGAAAAAQTFTVMVVSPRPVEDLSFTDWLDGRGVFGLGGRDFGSDPDGDGRLNVLEYAFGGDPGVADRMPPAPEVSVPPGVTGFLDFRYPRRRNAAAQGLVYAFESAPGPLGPWGRTAGAVEYGASVIDADGETETVVVRVPVAAGGGGDPVRLFRVRATLPGQPAGFAPLELSGHTAEVAPGRTLAFSDGSSAVVRLDGAASDTVYTYHASRDTGVVVLEGEGRSYYWEFHFETPEEGYFVFAETEVGATPDLRSGRFVLSGTTFQLTGSWREDTTPVADPASATVVGSVRLQTTANGGRRTYLFAASPAAGTIDWVLDASLLGVPEVPYPLPLASNRGTLSIGVSSGVFAVEGFLTRVGRDGAVAAKREIDTLAHYPDELLNQIYFDPFGQCVIAVVTERETGLVTAFVLDLMLEVQSSFAVNTPGRGFPSITVGLAIDAGSDLYFFTTSNGGGTPATLRKMTKAGGSLWSYDYSAGSQNFWGFDASPGGRVIVSSTTRSGGQPGPGAPVVYAVDEFDGASGARTTIVEENQTLSSGRRHREIIENSDGSFFLRRSGSRLDNFSPEAREEGSADLIEDVLLLDPEEDFGDRTVWRGVSEIQLSPDGEAATYTFFEATDRRDPVSGITTREVRNFVGQMPAAGFQAAVEGQASGFLLGRWNGPPCRGEFSTVEFRADSTGTTWSADVLCAKENNWVNLMWNLQGNRIILTYLDGETCGMSNDVNAPPTPFAFERVNRNIMRIDGVEWHRDGSGTLPPDVCP